MGLSPFFFGANKIMLNKRADKLELLRIAEAVALEKSIDKELIISSMETGIAKAAKSKFGQENEIKVSINRDNGDIELFRKLIIAENPENANTEIKLEDAINLNESNKDKSIGDEVLQPLPSFDFAALAIPVSMELIISSLSIDFSKATASAILNNSSLSALLFNILVSSKKKWAEAHFEISIM